MPFQISYNVVSWQIFHKHGVHDRNIASVLRTLTENRLVSISHSLAEILLPAVSTKLMSTLQTLCLSSWYISKLAIAYETVSTIFLRSRIIHVWKILKKASVKSKSCFFSNFILIIKPLLHQFICVPFKYSQELYHLI